MAKIDTLNQLGEKICSEYLGYKPTSNSTKPPHIANGIFRNCTGEYCDTRDLHNWIVSEEKNNSISSEQIIDMYQGILQNGYQENPTNIKEFRLLLEYIFNQDNTVYPSYEHSVTTISSHWLIKKRLPSEEGIGDFLFAVLSKIIDEERSPMIELLQNSLADDSDDLTKLIKPIITFNSINETRNKDMINYPDDIHWDECKNTIRKGFDNLANNIKLINESKNSLLVMKRAVCFAGFATFLYLTHANYAVYGGENVPILIDANAGLDSIKKASEQTYTAAKKSIEDYFVNSIKNELVNLIPNDSKVECQKWIDEMSFSSSTRADEVSNALNSYFTSFLTEGDSPILALSRALQIALYTFVFKSNSPSDFSRVLGNRCGLIGPKGNRAKIKRYLLNSFTLETITLSVMPKENIKDSIDFKSLGELLYNEYNILIGSDPEEEYKILEQYNVTQSTPGDLRGDLAINAQSIADIYVSLGLAKRYADGVTLIEWRQ